MSANKLLDNANRLWKMLDEMSENDPVCYRKFINKQMESFRKTISPPIIRFVVKLTQKSNKQPLIVNFCEWSIVPEPESSDSPISVKCGETFMINEVNGIALAFNPKVFIEHNFNESLKNDQKNNEEVIYSQTEHDDDNRYQLVWLGLNYLENEKSLSTIESLSVKYSNNPIRPKLLKSSDKYGSEQEVFKSLGFSIKPMKINSKINHDVDMIQNLTPEALMKLRNSKSTENDDDDDDVVVDSYDADACSSSTKLFKPSIKISNNDQNSLVNSNAKVLIEEIKETSIDSQEKTLEIPNSIPWSAKVINSDSVNQPSKANQLKLTFKLPGIKSGKHCNVDLKVNRVTLEVVDSSVAFRPLDLQLPCKIETDLAEAKFNSKKEKLIIRVPILSS